MTPVNFNGLMTDDLLKLLPTANENLEWELKGPLLLEPKQRKNQLLKHIGKQVSAFANSGGGYFVIGIEEKKNADGSVTRTPKPCNEAFEGDKPLSEWLPDIVHTSVDYPIRATEVHRVQFTSDPSKAVYVIEIRKSEASPHMSKGDGKYYYRAGRSSKPAPHWYLELLHNQKNKASLAITKVVVKDRTLSNTDHMRPTIQLDVTLKNTSFLFADHACVMVKANNPEWQQTVTSYSSAVLSHGYCCPSDKPLFPTGTCEMHAYFQIELSDDFMVTLDAVRDLMSEASFAIRPVSHDFVGPERVIRPLEDSDFVFSLAPIVKTLKVVKQRIVTRRGH